MKKIIVITIVSIITFLLLFKITEYYIGENIYKWYFLIPSIILGLFLSIWAGFVFTLLKPIRIIVYLIFYLLYFFSENLDFINLFSMILISIVIIIYEISEFNNLLNSKGLRITNLKINETETFKDLSSIVYHFNVSFDLKLGIRYDMKGKLINDTQKEMSRIDILSILSQIERDELLQKIKQNNLTEKRITGFEKEYEKNKIKFSLEITGKKEFIERSLNELI